MRSILPPKLQEEQDKLVEEYFNDDTYKGDLEAYVYEHGSKELLDFLDAYHKEVEEAAKRGHILN